MNETATNTSILGAVSVPPPTAVKTEVVSIFPPLEPHPLEKKEESSRRCRCCPQSRRGRIMLTSGIVLFLILVACICYFYIPRIPQFKVLYVQVRPVNGDIPLNITQNSNNPTDLSLKLPIFMGISVINPNRYDLTVDNFDLTAYIQPNFTALTGSGLPGSLVVSQNNNPPKKVGYGSYGSRNFEGNNFNTTFEIQVLLEYTPDPSLGLLNDPAFGELIQVCGFRNATVRTMLIKYDVGISIAFLSRIGIYPLLPNDVNIKCPLSDTKVKELTNILDGTVQTDSLGRKKSMFDLTEINRLDLKGMIGLGTFAYVQLNQDTVPITGRRRFMTVDKKTESHYGQMSSKMVLQQYHHQLLPSYHPKTQYVQNIAHKLLTANNIMKEADWKVYVVDNDSIVNAFVTPDGVIVVFSGIMNIAQNEAGLATVLGHEIAHKYARHHAERLSQQYLTGFLRFLLSAFFDIPVVPSAVWMDILLHKPNSRKHESEADRIGLEFMVNACYNPEEVVPFWRRMSKIGNDGAIPELLSTHPSSETRIENFKKWLPEAINKYEDRGCLRFSSFFGKMNRF